MAPRRERLGAFQGFREKNLFIEDLTFIFVYFKCFMCFGQ
jgi:hypothetical protein